MAAEETGGDEAVTVPQEQIMASLSLGELALLEAILSPSESRNAWQNVIRQERLRREHALAGLLIVEPPLIPESPGYDAALEPQDYLDQIRQHNITARLESRLYHRGRIKRSFAAKLASEYITQNFGRVKEADLSHSKMLGNFLLTNVHAVVITPRVLAVHDYEIARSRILQEYLPEVRRVEAGQFLMLMATVPQAVKAATDALSKLPFKAPLTNFFKIPQAVQEQIVAIVGDEWLGLCKLVQAIDDRLLSSPTYHTPALAFLSVQYLQRAIDIIDPSVCQPARICKTFLRSPLSFEEEMSELYARTEKSRPLESPPPTTRPEAGEVELMMTFKNLGDRLMLSRQEVRALLRHAKSGWSTVGAERSDYDEATREALRVVRNVIAPRLRGLPPLQRTIAKRFFGIGMPAQSLNVMQQDPALQGQLQAAGETLYGCLQKILSNG